LVMTGETTFYEHILSQTFHMDVGFALTMHQMQVKMVCYSPGIDIKHD